MQFEANFPPQKKTWQHPFPLPVTKQHTAKLLGEVASTTLSRRGQGFSSPKSRHNSGGTKPWSCVAKAAWPLIDWSVYQPWLGRWPLFTEDNRTNCHHWGQNVEVFLLLSWTISRSCGAHLISETKEGMCFCSKSLRSGCRLPTDFIIILRTQVTENIFTKWYFANCHQFSPYNFCLAHSLFPLIL